MKFGPILIFQNLFAFEIGRHITLMLFEKNSMYVFRGICYYIVHITYMKQVNFVKYAEEKFPYFLCCTYMLKFSTKAANENILAYVDDPISLVSTQYILKTDSEKIVESRGTDHYVLFLLRLLMNQSLSNCSIHPLRNDYTLIKLCSLYLAQL